MAQDFSLRYPLIQGQGNFGSVDGDPPAAMRYTEVRMARLAGELLADIEKETVDFIPNYDGSLNEPVILPARFPNLLVNGSSGIAVGMATNIPPHNLKEVIDATIAAIHDPEIAIEKMIEILPGRIFPRPDLFWDAAASGKPTGPEGERSSSAPGPWSKDRNGPSGNPSSSPKFPIRSIRPSFWKRSPNWCRTRESRGSPICATSRTGRECAWSSS